MKRLIVILLVLLSFIQADAQFPGTDSLRNYNNIWITNNAARAFTNYRLHTLLAGMIGWIDSARAGEGGTIGVDSIGVLNDSTFRYRKNGVFQSVVIKGGAVQHDITMTGTGLSGSHLKVDTTILKTVADAQRVTDSLVALLALKLNISDTAAMMQPLYDYIASDTIHIYTAADPSPDTLYSYKNGDSTLVGYIPKANAWSLTGNAGTNPANNFVGTTDAVDFRIRTDNTERINVDGSNGQVRFNEYTPSNFIGGDTSLLRPAAFDALGNIYRMPNWIGVITGVIKYTNLPELRTFTVSDTSVVYVDSKGTFYRYDPSDMSSADDSAAVIVTSGGQRLKRQFRNVYRPEDFGAVGDSTTDDAPAFQRMMNYINTTRSGGAIYCNPRGVYRIDNVIDLPVLSDGRTLVIEGNGATFAGNKIFRRRPPNQTAAANSWQGVSIQIRNCRMKRAGTVAGSVAIELGATYGAELNGNYIVNYDTSVVVRFGLNTVSYNNRMVGTNVGLVFSYGDIWGGGIATSQSNGSVSRNDRVYGNLNGKVAFAFYAASDVQLKNFIAEGAEMDYAVIFNDLGATVVKGFKIDGGHVEFVPGGANRASFFISQNGGTVEISNIYSQVADTSVIAQNGALVQMVIANWGFVPSGSKFLDVGGIGNYWSFRDMSNNFQSKNHLLNAANSGGFATNPARVATYSAGGITAGSATYTIFDTLGRGPSLNSGNIRIHGSHLIWDATNSFDIGISATGNAPRYVNAQTGFVTNATDGTYRWSTGNGIGFGPIGGDDQAVVMVRGVGVTGTVPTGSFGIPYGTTAQRTATNRNGLSRINSDSAAHEFKIGSAWSVNATRQWVRDQGFVSTNFANANLTLTGNRVHTLGANNLTFDGTGGGNTLFQNSIHIGDNTQIISSDLTDLKFATGNGVPKLQINSDGNVAIGNNLTPAARKLYVDGSVGSNKDSLPLNTTLGTRHVLVVDTSTNRYERIASGDLDEGKSGVVTHDPTSSNLFVGYVNILPDLNGAGGNQTATFPAASANSGKRIYVWNQNGDANLWVYNAAFTEPDGTTLTSSDNGTYSIFVSTGSVWLRESSH